MVIFECQASLCRLDMFSAKNTVRLAPGSSSTILDAFCALLQERLVYAPGERDMICMHHEFGIETASGKKVSIGKGK